MARYSRRRGRGGGKIEDIQTQLDSIQEQVNKIKNSSSNTVSESLPEPEPVFIPEPVSKPKPIIKSWVSDKTIKFNDGNSGRVTLSFDRIITLLDNSIKKNDTKKDWATIKEKLNNANSKDEVQDVINEYKIKFSSNYVAGTRKRRKNKGKKMSRKNK
jgi:hypothetical protein